MSEQPSANTRDRIARAQTGDTSAMDELLAGNEAWIDRLVARFGGGFGNSVYGVEDRMQDARAAFIGAVRTWTPKGGGNLRTWAYIAIRRVLLDGQEKQVRHSRVITGTNDPGFEGDECADEGANHLPFGDLDPEARAAALGAYQSLPRSMRDALRAHAMRRGSRRPARGSLAETAIQRIRAQLRRGDFPC